MTRYIRAGVIAISALLTAGFFAACPSPFGYYAAGNSLVETVATPDAAPTLLAATPVFRSTPAAGGTAVIVSGAPTESSDQLVTIETATADAHIYYTTDGSAPDPYKAGTSLYDASHPIVVAGNNKIVTINAVVFKSLMLPSGVATVTMTISYTTASSPGFSVGSNTANSPFTVDITTPTNEGTTIWYTTDGTPPVAGGGGSTLSGTSPITVTVDRTMTLTAIASGAAYTTSNPASASYTLLVLDPVINTPTGTYNNTFSATITDATAGATIWYTTDGTAPVVGGGGSTLSGASPISVNIGKSTTLTAVASVSGWTTSSSTSAIYTLVVLPPTVSVPGGTNLGGDAGTITATTPGSVVWYTTDGSTPVPGTSPGGTTSATPTLWKTSVVKAVASMPTGGWTSSSVASATYTSGLQLYYPFNDAVGSTTTPDISGNNWTGTLNAVTLVADRNGVANSAYSFNGTSSTITQSTFSVPSGTAVSLSMWINCAVSTTTLTRFLYTSGVTIGVSQTGTQIAFSISTPSTNSAMATITGLVGSWHFIVGTWDGTTVTLYVDGTQVGTASNPGTISLSTLTIGFNSVYWQGSMDDLRIYNRVLSPTEVQTLQAFTY